MTSLIDFVGQVPEKVSIVRVGKIEFEWDSDKSNWVVEKFI